ncbi:coiled-coil domain-containing protein 14 [Rhinophrynus dorsalis]
MRLMVLAQISGSRLQFLVLSSGRLTGPVRLSNGKKRITVRKTSTSSCSSLCSTDSEDQVLVINKGLDRCAALLNDILQNENVKDISPQNPHRTPVPKANDKSAVVKGKRSVPKKPSSSSHVHRETVSLRKSVVPSRVDADKGRPGVNVQSRAVSVTPHLPVTQPALCEHVQSQMSRLNEAANQINCQKVPAASSQTASEHASESATLFNCRLPTSTPALSPQHSGNPLNCNHEGYNQVLPQGEAARFPSGFYTTAGAHSVPTVMCYVPAPGQQNSAVPTCCHSTCQADALLQNGDKEKKIMETDLLHCIAAHLAQLQNSDGNRLQNYRESPAPQLTSDKEELTQERNETSSEEDDLTDLDIAPVRDISCQTSFNTNTLKPKLNSPEKTEKKITAVKYLLGEIKALVADQGDGEAFRLITELEHSVSLLPGVVGSTNIHAEIALALQPLRSENSQLRRRLRILNQQLRDRERAEKAARPEENDVELMSLQSMNVTLQHQLIESQKGLESLQSKNEELLKLIDVQKGENKKLSQLVQDKEQELLHIRQQSEIVTTKGRIDVDEAVGKMKSLQFKLEASEKENQILGITLRQRDAEVSRLREMTRTLQGSMAKLLCDLSKDNGKSKPGNSLTKSALDSYEKQLQGDQCPASTSIMSYLRKLETDQMFPNAGAAFSDKPVPSKEAGKSYIKGKTSDISEDFGVSAALGTSHKNTCHQSESIRMSTTPYSPEKHRAKAESECGTLTCDEYKPDDTTYLPLTSSPHKVQFVPSQRQMCTPPMADVIRDTESSSDHTQKCGFRDSGETPVGPGKDFVLRKSLTIPTGTLKQSGKLQDGICNMENHNLTVRAAGAQSEMYSPVMPSMSSLQIKQTDHSMFDFMSGRTDWSMSSFSTFTSHDEQDFRTGLAALDANIAQLQRTLQTGIAKK